MGEEELAAEAEEGLHFVLSAEGVIWAAAVCAVRGWAGGGVGRVQHGRWNTQGGKGWCALGVCPGCVGMASAGGQAWGLVAGHDRRERGKGPGDREPALEL